MRALGVIPSRREVRIIDSHSAPRISADQPVKIRSLEVGICGTDKEIASFVYGSPPSGCDYLVMGHECLGEVVEVGDGASGFKPGDLVVPSVRRPCDHPECLPCRSGRQDFCATGDFTERGIKKQHGYLTEEFVEEEKYLTRVPPELREVGVLVEPLTVAEKALDQVFHTQKRLPWIVSKDPSRPGAGLRAVVLGAGPVGILGTMALLARGFETHVYSRSAKPNPKAELVESLGATYISSEKRSAAQMAEEVGAIDLVYEAVGVAEVAFEVLQVLGPNGIFVFTGIPAPTPAKNTPQEKIMRRLVLKNQVAIGTVNADLRDFQNAVDDLAIFAQRWPEPLRALITGRYRMDAYEELLLGHPGGIKNVIALT